MPKSYVYRVRLDKAEIEQLDRLAEATGTTKAQAVRLAIKLVLRLFTGDSDSPEDVPSREHNRNASGNENPIVIRS
jgi:hypothetical protein